MYSSLSAVTRAISLGLVILLSAVPALRAETTSLPDGDSVTSKPFGKTAQGELVTLHTLTNKKGMSVSIMDYGATIVKILVPDRDGKIGDVVLGFDRFAPYLRQPPYFGATIGRYANRIAKGQFELAGTHYQLPINNGPNSLHGGIHGFDKHIWKFESVDTDIPAIRFSRLSPDGEEGYPGNLFASVTFSLNDDNELRISYEATTDKPTIINLTNHTYFNLSGGGSVLDDLVTLHADSYTPVDATLIPTGEIKPVADTPFDFRTPTPIGKNLAQAGGKPVGYDHNFVLKKGFFFNWSLAAEVYDPKSGRTLEVSTDQPGIQFYTGNFLDGTITGKGGDVYRQHTAFCLETQHFPDSPNHDNFPSVVLSPDDTYKTSTVYAFGVK
jgi:aldose 1-epimerase